MTATTQPELPQNTELERRLIEVVAAVPELYREAAFIEPTHFLDLQAGLAWARLVATIRAGETVDLLAYGDFLDHDRPPIATPDIARDYARRIASFATARNALAHASELAKAAWALDNERLHDLTQHAADIFVAQGPQQLQPAAAVASIVWDEISDPSALQAAIRPTGIPALDVALGGGLEIGTLTVLMARPGMGKTAALVQMSDAISERGEVCVVFSKEMSSRQWLRRAAFRRARANWLALRQGRLDDRERQKVLDEVIVISERVGLLLDDSAPQTSDDVARICEAVLRQHGRLDYVLADHVRLFADRADNETHRLGRVTWGFKQLAKRLGTRVVAAAQLSRAVEGQADRRPDLRDLRDSGEIEENADNVIALYRESYYTERPTDVTAEFIVRKARDGQRNALAKVAFLPTCMSFEKLERYHGTD